jgi:uncharacterized protein YbjQ (UPF0145 family)
MKQVKFNEELGHLVDENDTYNGRRFSSASGNSLGSYSTQNQATRDATARLIESAEKKGADAYEITSSKIFDSKQEYDSTSYTASVNAILYKN